MKKHILVLIAIAAFTTVFTTNAFGQAGKTANANVTFVFQIGERLYPAGQYQIESMNRQSDSVLRIRNLGDANKNQLIVSTLSNAGKGQTPRLLFRKYGETYFLSEIFLDTEQWGYSIRPCAVNVRTQRILLSPQSKKLKYLWRDRNTKAR